jgi:hypothetical protein
MSRPVTAVRTKLIAVLTICCFLGPNETDLEGATRSAFSVDSLPSGLGLGPGKSMTRPATTPATAANTAIQISRRRKRTEERLPLTALRIATKKKLL